MIFLNRLENLEGKQQNGANKFKHYFERKAHNPERQQDKPDDWEKKQQHHGQRPTQNEQDTPKDDTKKKAHVNFIQAYSKLPASLK